MHPNDQHRTVFTFERGHYEFTRMLFRLTNVLITFRLIHEFLRGIALCQIYMDNLLVFSKTETDHVRHLKRLFERVQQFGLKLSGKKSLLGHEKINFFVTYHLKRRSKT